MDKLAEHAIRMLEIVEGENDFFRNDEKRQADIARAVYDIILRVQMLEQINHKAEQTEPTISKMEQVDKDINVRSKDEPQTCSVNGRPYDCGNCEYHKCTADEPQIIACPINERAEYWFYEDEPQTDCETCKHYNPNHEAIACERCLDGKYSRYEPQTERSE